MDITEGYELIDYYIAEQKKLRRIDAVITFLTTNHSVRGIQHCTNEEAIKEADQLLFELEPHEVQQG